MKKYIYNILILSVLFSIFSSCSADPDAKLMKRWTLTKVVGSKPEDDKILGINNIFFDLKDDKTFTGRWYLEGSMTDFEDLKGTWLATNHEEQSDLFIFYGPKKKSKIYNIIKVTEDMMIMRISNIEHIFEAK